MKKTMWTILRPLSLAAICAVLTALVLEQAAHAQNPFAEYDTCSPSRRETTRAMDLDYSDYLYGSNGFRRLFDNDCQWHAGVEAQDYISAHQFELTGVQRRTLRYNAGRAFAFYGATDEAIRAFTAARARPDTVGQPLDWNAFMDAHIAFLRRNRADLLAAIDRLEAQPVDEYGVKANLDAANLLNTCFFERYDAIFTNRCQAMRG